VRAYLSDSSLYNAARTRIISENNKTLLSFSTLNISAISAPSTLTLDIINWFLSNNVAHGGMDAQTIAWWHHLVAYAGKPAAMDEKRRRRGICHQHGLT